MDRAATAAWLAEIAASKNYPFHLFEIEFDAADGGTQYLADTPFNVVFNAHTYTAAGYLLTFSPIEESIELKVSEISVQLSGVDLAYVAIMFLKQFMNRRLKIRRAFWKASDPSTMVVSPVLLYDGLMDNPAMVEDPADATCVVSVKVENEFADFERTMGRHTNHSEEQVFFPGDLIFQFVSDQNQQLVWGLGATPSGGVGGGTQAGIWHFLLQ